MFNNSAPSLGKYVELCIDSVYHYHYHHHWYDHVVGTVPQSISLLLGASFAILSLPYLREVVIKGVEDDEMVLVKSLMLLPECVQQLTLEGMYK